MTTTTNHYSNESLSADLTSTLPGPRRTAELLLTVPEHARRALVQEAHYVGNMVNMGRPSDSLAAAIGHFLRRGPESFTSTVARAIFSEDVAAVF